MFYSAFIVPLLVALLHPTLSPAFSWQFTAPPTQCSNVAISVVGSDGKPPYRVLIIPSGITPLPNNIDPRAVIDQPFDSNSTSISFAINYPANAYFVAVVSDANGFGTGGASVETMVANSGDSSCFDPTKAWSPLFYYGVGQDNQLTQCQPAFVWWEASAAQGTVSFVGVIPGGQSFKLPESSISTDPSLGMGFMWTSDIQGGTTVMIVAGDNRGMGTGGNGQFTVQSSSNKTCLNSGSPSSTPGVAAGSSQTTTSTSGTSTSSATGASTDNATNGGGPNVGIIVAATVGGIIGLFIVIALFVMCQSQYREASRRNRPLLPSMGQVSSIATSAEDALAHYHPEPLAFPGVDAYNRGQEGMAPGRASVVSPLPGSSLTSGSGARMSNTSSQVISSWYGQPPPSQGDSSWLQQTSGLASMNSGNLYDMSSQKGSKHLAPPPSPLQGASLELPQTSSGLASVIGGGGVYDTSGQRDSRYGAPSVTRLTLSTSGPPGPLPLTSSTPGSPFMSRSPSILSHEDPPPPPPFTPFDTSI